MKRLFLLCVILLGVCRPAFAQIHIIIDQPADKRFPIAVADLIKGPGFSDIDSLSKKIPEVIRKDLELSGYFFVIGASASRDRSDAITAETIDYAKWSATGALALVKGIAQNEGGRITITLKLFDLQNRKLQSEKQYTFDRKDTRLIGHRFTDEVLLATTGLRGPFASRLAYTSETHKKKHWKQVYVMDVDGANVDRLTKDNSFNLAPAWGPDGKQLVVTSYVDGFPDIYTIDLTSGHRRRITNNNSTNITPAWSPDGSLIAFSSAQERDPDLYVMSPAGGEMHPVSSAFGVDLAPRFSPDGSQIVFASERAGKLHLFKAAVNGGGAQRLTFHGYQNDSPDWSPDGEKIVFCGRGSAYDIFTMNTDGSNVQRLTVGNGSNEHPRWAPDGRYIVFSSTRGGNTPSIYMMRYDGAHQTKLTKGNGSLPDWSPWIPE